MERGRRRDGTSTARIEGGADGSGGSTATVTSHSWAPGHAGVTLGSEYST
jgi:hypothetical protein